MDDKEGKSMEEVQENRSLTDTHVHAQLEEGQEQNPNLVGSVELELETQNNIRKNGVELPSETPEDANIAAKPSNELHANAETDKLVSNVDSVMHRGSEVSMETESEKNGDEKGRVLKDDMGSKADRSVELYAGAETDNLVGKVDGESHHTEVPMEIEKEDEEGKALKDGVSSKANPSNEPCIDAETDNGVCKVEPDVPRDSEVAKEKLIDGLSSKVNPSNEPHISDDTDNVACKAELDMSCDSEVAMEKLIDGVSNKANPSNEPRISAESDNVVCKAELDMSLDSKVAIEKLMDGVSNEANPSKKPHISDKTDNVVCTVELNRPRGNEVETEIEPESDGEKGESLKLKGGLSSKTKLSLHTDIKEEVSKPKFYVGWEVGMKSSDPEQSFLWASGAAEGDDSGTEEEQAAFMREVENLYKERNLEFKAPKFYREELNLLKLWRAVIKLGGYEKVTSCKLWRQVGESFNPPKTCTTVSWTFRNFYEKALLEFEKHRLRGGELALPAEPTRVENRADGSHTLGSGRALRDAAARAMQGWHSQRLLGNGEVGDAIIKDKHLSSMPKSDKQLKNSGLLKRKKPYPVDCAVQVADMKAIKPQLDIMVFDIGPPADWVKINVKKFNDCFEVYALVPGLLREEVHVQSDPAGRLVIFGQPTQLDNPWGVTPFKKVVSLPSRIDPHQTSAVVTLNGQLFVRVPFEQSDF